MLGSAAGATVAGMAIATEEETATSHTESEQRLDDYVQRARDAAVALRALDQEAVDRIVWAMTVAGLEHAVDLAELAMEETHFGAADLSQSGGEMTPTLKVKRAFVYDKYADVFAGLYAEERS
jgi:acyl-CoA reductase-like NAD-dependent aldehyde dehydrogenase